MLSIWEVSKERLFRPVDGASLATFRILFGISMAAYVFSHTPYAIEYRYVHPNFFFSFPLFDWLHLKAWPRLGMYAHFVVMGLAACGLSLGLFFRFSCTIYFLTLSYIFLLEKTYSPNPIYLFILITFLLIFSGANRTAAADALFGKKRYAPQIPFWNLFILRAQIFIAYFYSGFAKLTHHDWRQGRPLRIWLDHHFQEYPFLNAIRNEEWLVYAFSYGGIVIDLTIGFLLCIRRTRWIGIGMGLFFHLTNKFFLGLGVFPWMMLTTLVLFLEPDAPRRFLQGLHRLIKWPLIGQKRAAGPVVPENISHQHRRTVLAFLIIYLTFQLLFPLRHWFYPGNVNWTQRGQHFSWHFMNNNMDAYIIDIQYTKPTSYENFTPIIITDQQKWFMSIHPDCILQYAHRLRDELKKVGVPNPFITLDARKSLNGRPHTPLIDTTVNLAEATDTPFAPADWILPHPDEQAGRD